MPGWIATDMSKPNKDDMVQVSYVVVGMAKLHGEGDKEEWFFENDDKASRHVIAWKPIEDNEPTQDQ